MMNQNIGPMKAEDAYHAHRLALAVVLKRQNYTLCDLLAWICHPAVVVGELSGSDVQRYRRGTTAAF